MRLPEQKILLDRFVVRTYFYNETRHYRDKLIRKYPPVSAAITGKTIEPTSVLVKSIAAAGGRIWKPWFEESVIIPYPRVLHVDSSYALPETLQTEVWVETIDYRVYDGFPRWLRKLEEWLRLDLYLAWQASRRADQFDVILAGSEKVAIPLALLIKDRPLITVVYHVASPLKRWMIRLLGAPRRWQRIGYLTTADRNFVEGYFRVPREKTFRYIAAPLNQFTPSENPMTGPIISVGVSKRDYKTLIAALQELPDCPVEIYATSRYPDNYRGRHAAEIPSWVEFVGFVPPQDFPCRYHQSRFVVLPLHDTTQFSAGFSVALEAHAASRAIIATDTPGMRDYIQHGVTGLLVPPYDPAALRQAIKTLWDDPALAGRMGQAGRQFVESHFDPRHHIEHTRQVIADVVGLSNENGLPQPPALA